MAKVIIGGEERTGDLDVFEKVERAWPFIEKAQGTKNLGEQMTAMVTIAAIAVGDLKDPVDSPTGKDQLVEFKRKLRMSEMADLSQFFRDVLEEAKITRPPVPGAPAAAPPGGGSTATSTR